MADEDKPKENKLVKAILWVWVLFMYPSIEWSHLFIESSLTWGLGEMTLFGFIVGIAVPFVLVFVNKFLAVLWLVLFYVGGYLLVFKVIDPTEWLPFLG